MVLGIFTNRNFAERAILDLETSGYNPKDISIIMRDQPEYDEAEYTEKNISSGAVTGMATGGVVGGIAGLLIGMGAVAIPGLGGVLVGGPLAAALGFSGAAATTVSGAVTGALAGGLLGALVGLGMPESDAALYEQHIRNGAILLAVPEMGKRGEVIDILEENSALNIRIINDLSQNSIDGAIRPEYRPMDESQYYGYAGAKGGEVGEDVPEMVEVEEPENRSMWQAIKESLFGKRS